MLRHFFGGSFFILLMEEILHHLGCIKPQEDWDIYYTSWCRISSINSMDYSKNRGPWDGFGKSYDLLMVTS